MRRCLRRASETGISTTTVRCRVAAVGTGVKLSAKDAVQPGGSSAAASSSLNSATVDRQGDAVSNSSSSPSAAATVAESSTSSAPPTATVVKRPKWSFITNPNDRDAINLVHHSNSVVPNNDAKPLLPMWSSSLTSPKLEKLRLSPDSWVTPFLSAGYHSDEDVELFVRWVVERAEAAERCFSTSQGSDHEQSKSNHAPSNSFLAHALRHHIRLKPRAGGSCRGVYARRDFANGDVIAAIPVSVGTPTSSKSSSASTPLWGLILNSDTLRHHSTHAQRHRVPSFAKVQELMAIRRSQFDPFPHELFVDQVYAALFLACEKEAGHESPLYPYLRLLPDPAVDDDTIKAQHHDIMEPNSWREYEDHRGSMRAFLFRIRDEWVTQVDAANDASSSTEEASSSSSSSTVPPPPSMASLEWALRTILARQVMIPSLRSSADVVERLRRVATENDRLNQEEFWMRNVTKVRQFFLRHVLRVLDEEAAQRANAFDPLTIATLTPIVDMLQHDALGGNVKVAIPSDEVDSTAAGSSVHDSRSATPASEVLIVATQPIRAGQELRRCFSRCYSASYTLYRYGFLAVRDRVLDRECDLLAAGHSPEWIGASRTVEQMLDCDGEVRAISVGPRVFSLADSSSSSLSNDDDKKAAPSSPPTDGASSHFVAPQ